MSEARLSDLSFMKLVVDDLEKMSAFYREVFDLHDVARIQAQIGDEPIDEIMLSPNPDDSFGPLMLLKWVKRAGPQAGAVILGGTTSDLPGLLDRVRAAGGGIAHDTKDSPEMGVRAAFATDPEGNLLELVQPLG